MLLLNCPHCGPRNETEFNCGGESHVIRPSLDCSDVGWANYLFFHHNPKGVNLERWRHTFGCGRWFNVARDTISHNITAIYSMSEPRPDTSNGCVGAEVLS
ncbi:sarcosine oxidase subunit delta [Novosphingobium sp. P6W]|uniref:sarcosine oxidase subunit delta n=1 Tax=Novosphingobium sp. P6W TaxID=1609758 RepID=UPI0009E60734|nr:sarcosine oxidase subunit delta [Novosphingobium sp. P6W]AXB78820.1 sarcosine oxidase subunit delta [Novosphingobium sp. P6W]